MTSPDGDFWRSTMSSLGVAALNTSASSALYFEACGPQGSRGSQSSVPMRSAAATRANAGPRGLTQGRPIRFFSHPGTSPCVSRGMAFFNPLRHVLRRLGRAPMFTALTVATLAIALGATTAIFSVLNGVLLKPLPYPHSEELVGVWHTAPGISLPEL